jgi:SEC-C motif
VPGTARNINPEDYEAVPVYELLQSAAHGYIGLDHRFLRAILGRRVEAMPDLLRFAAEDHEKDPVLLEEDLLAIFRHWSAPEALPFYLQLIRREPEDISDEIVDSLVNLGTASLEPLLALYGELGEENAGDIAFLLAALHLRDPRILKILTDRLEYDVSDAALCLDVYGDPAAIPALDKMLAQLKDQDPALTTELTNTIEILQNPKTLESDPHHAFDVFELYPEEASPAFDALGESDLLAMLASTSAKRRAEVAEGFFQVELSDKAKAALFELAQRDPDDNVRGRSWEALAEHGEEIPIRKALLLKMADKELPMAERTGLLVALASQTDNPRVLTAIEDLYREPTGRAKALEAMWRSFNPEFAKYPPQHLDDPDLEIRRQAIWGVGQLGLTKEAARLKPFFDSDDLRPDAIFNYALSVPTEVTRGRMRGVLDRIEEVAGGLTTGETELVEMALDQRLDLKGLKPVFAESGDDEESAPPAKKVGRNDPCPCGSGKKYKKCCGA